MTNTALRACSAALAVVGLIGSASVAHADRAPPYFAVCSSCHVTSPDGSSAQGPNLRGVVGRKAGSDPKYSYSAALKGASIVWTEQNLDKWLTKPNMMVPGTKMMISVQNAEDRQKIIDYLLTFE